MCTSGIMYEQEEEEVEVAEEAKIQYNRPKEIITLNGIKYQRIDL